jgi:carbamoyltransferase
MAEMSENYVLGIWDGHDAGAALVKGDRVVCAANEERFSRRKLDVGFPALSVRACLADAGIGPGMIQDIAATTTDPAKTLTRLFPSLKEEYYLIRRRKKDPSRLDPFKKRFKYRFTEYAPNSVSRLLSLRCLKRDLLAAGLAAPPVMLDHHRCHAEAAARTSRFDECLVITLDGVGDGLSGSLWNFRSGNLSPAGTIPASNSVGIFFEHVTTLLNMRELEDEGKVMALADYAYPVSDGDNPLLDLLKVEGLSVRCGCGSGRLYDSLARVLWRFPSEQFAWMAQRATEKCVQDLAVNAAAATKHRKIAVSGGVFSNIKVTMKIAETPGMEDVYVFPHMGDGGLALGAAIGLNFDKHGVERCRLDRLDLGPADTPGRVEEALAASGFNYRQITDAALSAAEAVCRGEIVLWYQGRMEFGPRALGNRSILARPDDRSIKDRLNLILKKRVWYQPFCPSMLMEDAPILLDTRGRHLKTNLFMTTAFRVREEHRGLMEGVIGMDGTCRPQFVDDESPGYRTLLENVKSRLGYGVVLNTSMNIHGEPLVCSPEDALTMFARTDVPRLFIENFEVTK